MSIFITTLTSISLSLSTTPITWSDAGTLKTFFILPQYVADFNPDATVNKKNTDSGSIKKNPFVAIYKVKDGDNKNNSESTSTSPVFSASTDGPPQYALPGGVIVYFKKGVSEEMIEKWARLEGVQLKNKLLNSEQSVWLVDTPPGMIALEYAKNFLHNQELVDKTTPNWWYHAVVK